MLFKNHFSRAVLICLVSFASFDANAFDIFALGTSNLNCKGVPLENTVTVRLEKLLKEDGINARVINSAKNGDKPIYMVSRIQTALENPKIKIVLFEPGPNDKDKSSNIEYTEKILALIKEKNIPTVYFRTAQIQSEEEGEATAKKFNAIYYGNWTRDIPVDTEHRQYDTGIGAGHLASAGCVVWAKNIYPIVKKIITDNQIKD